MRIIFLNTWNGRVKGIGEFITSECPKTDIFCFQEAYQEMKLMAKALLPKYKCLFGYKQIDNDDFPQATCIKDGLQIVKWTKLLKKGGLGLEIFTQISHKSNRVNLCNFHGRSQPGDKLDTPERLEQSRQILEYFDDLTGVKIIGGDFNLFPETKSIKMFEQKGYRNLIKEFNVPTTRNRLIWDKYPKNKQFYSDYVFVSLDVKVREFSVPNIEISDHLPMILEIE